MEMKTRKIRFSPAALRLYAVTDRRYLPDRSLTGLLAAVEEAIRGGVTMVQLREKELSDAELLPEAEALSELCHAYDIPLIIDDHVSVCLKSGADGVHLGQNDTDVAEARRILGPDRIIGATAHCLPEALQAEREGADYLGCGAAFATQTKTDATPISREEYRRITEAVRIPVCAIGGINAANIGMLQGLGLQGAAVVSGIFAAPDIREAAAALYARSKQTFTETAAG